jgi:hypothetical protein
MPGLTQGEHSPLWGTIPQKGVESFTDLFRVTNSEEQISAVERDFSEQMVTVFRDHAV